MSEFTAIRAVSETLKGLLEDFITHRSEPELHNVPIDLRSPREMRADNEATGISLWLYRVTRNADMLNHPPERTAPNKLLHRPLPIDLYYLVTPIAKEPADEQVLMGRVMQVFNDHPVLRGSDLRDALQGGAEELRLILESQSLEELTKVWTSLQESYQLSVTYVVQMLGIDSDVEPVETAPVTVRQTEFDQILKS
jgi:hypothetical protein